jgi:hypothetical protein
MKEKRNSRRLRKRWKTRVKCRKRRSIVMKNVTNSSHATSLSTSNFEHKITSSRRVLSHHLIILSIFSSSSLSSFDHSITLCLNINCLSWTSIITSLSSEFEEKEDSRQHFVNYVWRRTNDVEWELVLANARNAQKWEKQFLSVTWMQRHMLSKQRVSRTFISIDLATDEIN